MTKAVFISPSTIFPDITAKEAFFILEKTGFKVFKATDYGSIIDIAKKYDIDLDQSWLIGSMLDEIETGNRLGCSTVLIADGLENKWQVTMPRQPLMVTNNLENAAGALVLRMIYNAVKSSSSNYFSSLSSSNI